MSQNKRRGHGGVPGEDTYTSRSIRYPLIVDEGINLMGQVLTIIDASITGPIQNKSVKDLIKQRFDEKLYRVFWDYCYRKEFDYSGEPSLANNIVEGTQSHDISSLPSKR